MQAHDVAERWLGEMVGISERLGKEGQEKLLEELWRTLLERPSIAGDGATHYHGPVIFNGPVSYHGNVFYGSTHHHCEAEADRRDAKGEEE